MRKDVIYIDIEDDITAIIGKVKAADSKIVALVPPKRIGVLQSIVNLKLLNRAASGDGKRIVVITNDQSLISLAAGLKIPVAKNLQTRPEVPTATAPVADEPDVIDGQELPVGDVAASLGTGKADAKTPVKPTVLEKMDEKIDLGTKAVTASNVIGAPKAAAVAAKTALIKAKSNLKIPNFNDFRKKLFLFGGLGVLLIAILVWAFVIAPRAKVTISARTTAVNIDKQLSLNPGMQQSTPDKLQIKPQVAQVKKPVAVEFEATGTKEIGNKASGSVRIKNCDSSDPFTIGSGTTFTAADGHKFTNNAAINVPGFTGSASTCRNTGIGAGTADAAVTAADVGPEYNIAPTSFTISGITGDVYVTSSAAMSGGTRETVKVVADADVEKAKQQLPSINVNEVKAELKKQFNTTDFIIIDESFTADQGKPVVVPAVGEQAQKAKVTIETTYTLIGVARADATTIIEGVVNEALKNKVDQQKYTLGDDKITFQLFEKGAENTYNVHMVTTASIGPKIDTAALARQISGKRYGEIQAIITPIEGVNKVDITFSPFWVTTAPAPQKIEITFSVSNDD